jgi:hypothetical protein
VLNAGACHFRFFLVTYNKDLSFSLVGQTGCTVIFVQQTNTYFIIVWTPGKSSHQNRFPSDIYIYISTTASTAQCNWRCLTGMHVTEGKQGHFRSVGFVAPVTNCFKRSTGNRKPLHDRHCSCPVQVSRRFGTNYCIWYARRLQFMNTFSIFHLCTYLKCLNIAYVLENILNFRPCVMHSYTAALFQSTFVFFTWTDDKMHEITCS